MMPLAVACGLLLQPMSMQSLNEETPLRYPIPLASLAILEVVPERDTYEVAEPVQLRFTVKNTSAREFRCYCIPMYAAAVSYRLLGQPSRELKFRVHPQFVPIYRLKPGESVSEVATVYFDRAKGAPPFDLPGTYEVRAVYFDGGAPQSRLSSKPVSMHVVDATDKAAYSAYSKNLAMLAQLGMFSGTLPAQVNEEAARFVEEYGESLYAAGVRRGLMERLRDQVLTNTATDRDRELYDALRRQQPAQPNR